MSGPHNTTKRLCIVTPEFPPEQWGGLARTAQRIAQHSAAMGLEVHVAQLNVSSDRVVLLDENRETRTEAGIVIHKIMAAKEAMEAGYRDLWDCPHTMTLRMMHQSLEMLLRDYRFHLFNALFLYPTGYVTGMLARRFDVPFVVTLAGNDIKKYLFSPEKVSVCKSGLENADLVVGLSRDLVEMAHCLTPVEDRARVIYNSVEIPLEAWRPRSHTDGPFRIGCAGIFKYAKGLPYLVKAVSRLAESRNLVIDLRGKLRDEEQEVFRTIVKDTGTTDIVRLSDPLPHEQVWDWLRSLDAFVLPSVSEGCPNILMEALATGVPVVATRTGAAQDLVEDGVSGLLVPWGDSAALAQAISRLMDDPAGAGAMAEGGRRRMELFSAERERKEWERVYGQLVDL